MIQQTKRSDRANDEIAEVTEKEQTQIQGDGTDPDTSPLTKHLNVLGMASRPNSRDLIGAAVRSKFGERNTLVVPLELLGTNNKAGSEDFLLRNGTVLVIRRLKYLLAHNFFGILPSNFWNQFVKCSFHREKLSIPFDQDAVVFRDSTN
jgi:hypothetical protein